MDVVVADATPLNYLILIDPAEVLPQLFTNIHIPPKKYPVLAHWAK